MDLFSCIALIVFGLIVLIGRFIMVKKGALEPFDIRHPFKYGLPMFILNLFLLGMGAGTLVSGIVYLFLI